MITTSSTETLGDLRCEIDRIDRAMHALLMERGTIIDRIIAAKKRLGGGSAFHPGREAAMMRALAERHCGELPLDTVESIWRVIISTFTFIQMNYCVHADGSADPALMRDSARFHFGFTVPYRVQHDAAGVLAAVASSYSDLGMLPVTHSAAWWQGLAPADAPKVIARLPFVERPDHPAGLPVYVVAKPLAEAAACDVMLYAVSLEHWCEPLRDAVTGLGGEVVDRADGHIIPSMLIAVPGEVGADLLAARLADAGAGATGLVVVGSHARRFEMGATPLPSRAAE